MSLNVYVLHTQSVKSKIKGRVKAGQLGIKGEQYILENVSKPNN